MLAQLDLSSFEKAMLRLEEALRAYAAEPDNSLYRDAIIQRFAFTYELAHKTVKRYLDMTAASPGAVDEMAFADLIRTGSEQGLLQNGWDIWREYRKARSITSHTYDEGKAKEVVAVIPRFLQDSQFLFEQLRRRSSIAR